MFNPYRYTRLSRPSRFPTVQISKKCEYALRLLVDLGLARAAGRDQVSATELSRHERMPAKFTGLILHELRQQELVRSTRGARGGFALSPKGRRIAVGNVVRLMHGPLAPIACVSKTAYAECSCPDEDHCGLRMLMTDVRNAVAAILDKHSIDDLVQITVARFVRDGLPLPFSASC